jgi:hypothetical protein
MSVCKGKTKVTDYASIEARLEEEGELDSLWGTSQFGPQDLDFWFAPDETYADTYHYPQETKIFGNERKNQERSYTSSLRSRQASNNPVNNRKQKISYPRYRCRR